MGDLFLDRLVEKISAGTKTQESVELRKYVNIIDWVGRGLGLNTIYSYTRQYQVLRDFYELLCPNCMDERDKDCWGKTEEELRREVLLELDWNKDVFLCPVCGFVRERLKYDTLGLCIGMRSGKSVAAAIIASYTTMLWFAAGGRLDKRFGLIPGQRMRLSMVCTSGAQTEKTVWGAYTSLMDYMQDVTLKKLLSEKQIVEKEGLGLTNISKIKEVEWRFNNLEILSLHSNSGSLAGGTGLLSILDEYSRFDLGESKRSAAEVHAVLERSLRTIRSLKKTAVDDLFGRFIVIGSPYYTGEDADNLPIDPLLRLIKQGGEKQLGLHLPTWEFNPYISREDLDDEYRRDYWSSERDYGANPKGGALAFFENQDVALSVIVPGQGIEFSQVEEKRGEIKFITGIISSFNIDKFAEYTVHVDLSVKHDKLSMAFAKKEGNGVVVVGVMVLVPTGGLSIWIDTPLEILLALKNDVKIKLCTFDQWNSVSAIQRLEVEGIPVRRRSIGDNELEEYKKLSYLGLVKVIDTGNEGIRELKREIKTVRRVDGKIAHVDVLMSVAGAVTAWTFKEVDKNINKVSGIAGRAQKLGCKVIPFRRW